MRASRSGFIPALAGSAALAAIKEMAGIVNRSSRRIPIVYIVEGASPYPGAAVVRDLRFALRVPAGSLAQVRSRAAGACFCGAAGSVGALLRAALGVSRRQSGAGGSDRNLHFCSNTAGLRAAHEFRHHPDVMASD